MNDIPCLGLSFLAECIPTHHREHFLFNFEVAITSFAVVIAIYSLILERRYRVRIYLKRRERNFIFQLFSLTILLTFIGAILPFIPGEALPLFGYPVFWELVAAVFLIYIFYLSYSITRPITSLTKSYIKELVRLVPQATIKYHGLMDLMLREADSFWPDFLKKAQTNRQLRLLLRDFLNPDFTKLLVTSGYILVSTYRYIGRSEGSAHRDIERFFSELFIHNLVEDNSILAEDLDSSYKPITQEIIREYKLADIIFRNADLFFFRLSNYDNWPKIFHRFSELFKLYLGDRYHHTEDESEYISLIKAEVIKDFLEFFKNNLHHLSDKEKEDFISELSFSVPLIIKNLPESESRILADGIYELLEEYAVGKDWQKEDNWGWGDFHILHQYQSSFVDCNGFTKNTFQDRLATKIAGTENKENVEYYAYNLKGFYPMMVPVYFHMYGPELFSKEGPKEDLVMHMKILKKMKENLPILASGITQYYMADKQLPKDKRGKEEVKRQANEALKKMFPTDVYYNAEDNSITRISGRGEVSCTILLNETIESGNFVYKDEAGA
ncbi:MAG: hypothetical protein KIH67_000240 [Candidatus Moranbacteria bacterium]|nr:hypothetical protein [Candidatus Moranbacteria bacterium]